MHCRRYVDRVAVVTGASSGIGAASARRLAAEGATVVLADIADAAGAAIVEQITADGGAAEFRHCDVADAAAWAELHDHVAQRHGRLDVLHGNAYLDHAAPLHELSPELWDRIIAVSLTGNANGVRAFLPLLHKTSGSVVLTASVHALFGLPGRPAYAAAKGGLCALGRQLAVEYAPEVRVNVVLPGPIMTAAWDEVSEQDRRATVAATPAQRFGRADEVAAAVAFLGSADASFVTGVQLLVDGGWSVAKSST